MSKKRGPKRILQLDDCVEEEVPNNFPHLGPQANYQIGNEGMKFEDQGIQVSKMGIIKTNDNQDQQEFINQISKNDIEFGKFIGKGAAGYVYEGFLKKDKTRVAIKSINAYDKEKQHQLMNDIKILLQNKQKAEQDDSNYCPFLVQLYGAYFDEGCVKVILELMDAGSLGDALKLYRLQHQKFDQCMIEEPILARISQQVLNGLAYLDIISHQIHRDIKPDNILFNSNGIVKLTDFGISKEMSEDTEFCNTFCGTLTYMYYFCIQNLFKGVLKELKERNIILKAIYEVQEQFQLNLLQGFTLTLRLNNIWKCLILL